MTDGGPCRLCGSSDIQKRGRVFLECNECGYIFRSVEDQLSDEEEKARYDLHRNFPEDAEYVAFLNRLRGPVLEIAPPPRRLFEFGSGPAPVLAELFQKDGYDVSIFDPFYAPEFPDGEFDIITASEVLEHLRNPYEEIERLVRMLSKEGYLAVMTLRAGEETDLDSWHYARDPTHVGFFSEKTFRWIEKEFSLERAFDDGERVVVWKKID